MNGHSAHAQRVPTPLVETADCTARARLGRATEMPIDDLRGHVKDCPGALYVEVERLAGPAGGAGVGDEHEAALWLASRRRTTGGGGGGSLRREDDAPLDAVLDNVKHGWQELGRNIGDWMERPDVAEVRVRAYEEHGRDLAEIWPGITVRPAYPRTALFCLVWQVRMRAEETSRDLGGQLQQIAGKAGEGWKSLIEQGKGQVDEKRQAIQLFGDGLREGWNARDDGPMAAGGSAHQVRDPYSYAGPGSAYGNGRPPPHDPFHNGLHSAYPGGAVPGVAGGQRGYDEDAATQLAIALSLSELPTPASAPPAGGHGPPAYSSPLIEFASATTPPPPPSGPAHGALIDLSGTPATPAATPDLLPDLAAFANTSAPSGPNPAMPPPPPAAPIAGGVQAMSEADQLEIALSLSLADVEAAHAREARQAEEALRLVRESAAREHTTVDLLSPTTMVAPTPSPARARAPAVENLIDMDL